MARAFHSVARTLILPVVSLSALFIFCLMARVTDAQADLIKVVCFELYDNYQLELEPGGKADVTVFLRSSGDPFEGYRIQLYRFPFHANAAPLKELPCDVNGVATFRGLEAGNYHVQVKQPENSSVANPVDIGDIRIKRSFMR